MELNSLMARREPWNAMDGKKFKISIVPRILNLVFVLVENGYAPRKYVLKDTETLNPMMWRRMRMRRRVMMMRVQRRTLT